MSLFGRILLVVGLAALLIGGLSWIFRVRVASDSTPAYSSLRADPLGARGFHDALDRMSGIRVERWVKPLERLPVASGRTILLFGMETDETGHQSGWSALSTTTSNLLDDAARSGGRVVIAFAANDENHDPPKKKPPAKKAADDAKPHPKIPAASSPTRPDKSSPERTETDPETGEEIAAASPAPTDWERLWGFRVETKHLMGPHAEDDVRRTDAAPADLPATLAGHGDVHFKVSQGTPWRVLYTHFNAPVVMEMPIGRGTVVLLADSYPISNEALQKDRSPELLAWLVGPNSRVTFDESHLGVLESPGVATLARRYGLGGAFFTLLLLAALFLWRRLAWFVPPTPEMAGVELSYQPTAGLEALLRRSVPPARLLPTCVAEWRRTARAGDAARVEAAVATAPSPLAAHNAAVRALRHR